MFTVNMSHKPYVYERERKIPRGKKVYVYRYRVTEESLGRVRVEELTGKPTKELTVKPSEYPKKCPYQGCARVLKNKEDEEDHFTRQHTG